jgi:hypothetical protein
MGTAMYSASVSGINAANLLLSATADNLANLASDGYKPWRVAMTPQPGGGVEARVAKSDDGEDLVDDVTGLMTGSLLCKANARAIRVGAETEQSLFDSLA